jgi:uncharacterized Zn-binding protein involved in type VI secretion
MPASTRVGDSTTGICDLGLPDCPHARNGTNGVGSPNVFINGKPAHRLNDTGPTNCPHGGTFGSVEGSSNVIVNGQPLTRIGDTTQCVVCGQSGAHVSGSPNVFAGG